VLIEKEWISFGHQFARRVGHGKHREEHLDKKRSPIFIQWIDAVYNVMLQFPTAFEFNELFLVDIADALLSCRFGNFLGNCEFDKREMQVPTKTQSMWAHLPLRDYWNESYAEDAHMERGSGAAAAAAAAAVAVAVAAAASTTAAPAEAVAAADIAVTVTAADGELAVAAPKGDNDGEDEEMADFVRRTSMKTSPSDLSVPASHPRTSSVPVWEQLDKDLAHVRRQRVATMRSAEEGGAAAAAPTKPIGSQLAATILVPECNMQHLQLFVPFYSRWDGDPTRTP
jgi:hypothetical protein